MDRESLIDKKFKEWREKGLLDKKGELFVEEEWKIKDLLIVFSITFLIILLFLKLLDTDLIMCFFALTPFIPLFIFRYMGYYISATLKTTPSLSISKKGIVKRFLTFQKTIKFDNIKAIKTDNFDTNSFTIQSKSHKIVIPYILSKWSSINPYQHEVLLFFKEIFPEKIEIPENPSRRPDIVKLFAAIVSVSHDEKSMAYAIDYLRNNFEISHDTTFVPEHFAYYCETATNIITDICLRVAKSKSYTERKELLDHLFECAYMSDGVDVYEMNVLLKIAKYFVIKEWDFKAMQYKYEFNKSKGEKEERKKEKRKKKVEESFKNVTTEAHRTLSVKSDATIEEIKTAYHEKAMKVHPDKLPADATPQQIEEANENFRVINEAYKFLVELDEEKISVHK